MSLETLLAFTSFTHKFQQVKRKILNTGSDVDENDAEHSYQLALIGWYLISAKQLPLDLEKVLLFSLAHDLVEVYAGDTYFHTTDTLLRESKELRELEAADRIATEFSEFPELHQVIQDYEKRESPEAKFVYALDKLLPVLNIYLDGGKSWQRDGVTLEMARTKTEKIAESPEVLLFWNELLDLLEQDEGVLFPIATQ